MGRKYYESCSKEESQALLEMAQMEADRLMEVASDFFSDNFSARAYLVDHGDHYSIAGAIIEDGTETRHFDPITGLFEEVREQIITHMFRTIEEEEGKL